MNWLYNHSPVWFQNLAISTYGMWVRRIRYGAEHTRQLGELLSSQAFSATRLTNLQEQRLRSVVQRAFSQTAYYSAIRKYRSIDPNKIDLGTYASIVPPVSQALVRRDPAQFSVPYRGHVMTLQTSGSTGAPIRVKATSAAVATNFAFFARFLSWHSVSPFDGCATFAGRLVVPPAQQSPPYWRRNRAMNTTLFSSYRLHDNTVADYIAELNRLTPVYIDSYPSSIYHIAEASRRKGIAITARPKVVVTSSEMLSPDQRWAIETAFECPVRDQYGCAEMVGWLGQCEQGSYHSSPEYGLFEVIRDDGTACSPGEVGNVCLTGFVNPLMPVLRYLIGVVGVFAIYMLLGSLFPRGETLIPFLLRYLRYTLIGLWVAFIAPWLFIRLKLARPAT